MNNQQILQRQQQLVDELNKHIYNYYVLDSPVISDADYDKMFYELVDLEEQTKVVLPGSPTQRVGGEVLTGFKKVTHASQLFSLNKCNSVEELQQWILDVKKQVSNPNFSVEYKFDGLRIIVKYKNGIFVSASTRGNGVVGEDVTEQVKTIKSVPLVINYKGEVAVQGEGMITLSNLEKYNKNATEKLKNARNAAAGAIRNLDPKVTASRNLDVFFYDIMEIDNSQLLKTQEDCHKFLIENGFLVSKQFTLTDSIDEMQQIIEKIDKEKSKLDILIDGLVFKLNDIKQRQELGFTSRFPKWAIAFKFKPQELTSVLHSIINQVGRTGKITPVGVINEVELAGAIVTRATLNNYDEIAKKKIQLNSLVFVRRSNEVIPEILGLAQTLEQSKPIIPPFKCPSCGAVLQKDGPNLFCPNTQNCKEQVINKLAYFGSRNCMNIEGFSEKTAETLYNSLGVKSLADLYKLTKEDLIELEGFKIKKATNLIDAIQKSKTCNLNNFLDALSIDGVGEKTSKDLAKKFKTLNNLKLASLQDLEQVRDVGGVIASNIYNYFRDEGNLKTISELLNCGLQIKELSIVELSSTQFSGKKVVLTGTLLNFKRDQATLLIEKLGGEVVSSVSKNTNYVLAGEDAGSKLAKAQALNVAVLNEQQFVDILKKHNLF